MSDARDPRAAVDLLLAAGDNVEKVHQAAWFALLQHSELLAELLEVSMPGPRRVEWEPDGRLFDLMVTAGDERAWLELKVDSALGEGQLRRQLEYVDRGRVVHVLLGLTNIRARPGRVELAEKGRGYVFGPEQVIAALGKVEQAGDVAPEVRQLARSYAASLDVLRRRGEDFRKVDKWNVTHSAWFFEKLRRACPEMKDATIEYVPSPSGGFEACHWGWVNAGEGRRCYVQWEDDKLCVKILVEDRSARRRLRTVAVEFLSEYKRAGEPVAPPTRLGSGRTMTVGVVKGIPVRDEARWGEVIAAAAAGTKLVAKMAKHLAAAS